MLNYHPRAVPAGSIAMRSLQWGPWVHNYYYTPAYVGPWGEPLTGLWPGRLGAPMLAPFVCPGELRLWILQLPVW